MPKKVIHLPERDRSPLTRAVAVARRHAFTAVAAALFTGALFLVFGWFPDLDRQTMLALLTFAWGVIVGYPVSNYVRGKLGEEPGVFIADVAVEDLDHDGGLYWLPFSDFKELTVTDGSLDQWAPFFYCGKHVDLEDFTAEGVWRGTMTDRELMTAISAVKECRGMLEEDAREAFAIQSNIWSIVYRSTKDATKSVVKTFETGTLPDEGDGIDRAVDDALDSFGLERVSDGLDDLDLEDDDLGDDLVDDQDEPISDQTLEEPAPADD